MTYHLRPINENNLPLGGIILRDLAEPLAGDVIATAEQYADQISDTMLKYKKSGNSVIERTNSDKATQINKFVDNETYQLIRSWCESQPEGCEEAFLNRGLLAGILDTRYITYKDQRAAIIASQAAKKV